MPNVPTPHNSAAKDDIAKTVIMPGDPMRSKWIAGNFLEDARLVNNVRGVQGYTGTWKGMPVTVMASGMGIPSISIYAYELYNFYDVDLIIRTGTAGSIQPDVKVRDIVIADKAYTNSGFLSQMDLPDGYIPEATKEVLKIAEVAANRSYERMNTEKQACSAVHTGPVLTEELYYSSEEHIVETWAERGVLAFEMEAAALYANAAQAGKNALALFTVSNSILTGEEMPPEERETSLTQMVNTALETARLLRQQL